MSTTTPATIVIQPAKGLLNIDWKELWLYRELFFFLVWREILVRYKQTLLGAAWAVLQPFLSMIVFTLFFGRLAGLPSDGVPYPLFSYTAMVLWTFYSQSMQFAANSMVANANLVTKIYFPRVIMPLAPALSFLVDLVISLALLFLLMPVFSFWPSANMWAAPIAILIALVSACGVSLLLGSLTVLYRDFRYVTQFLIQFWMFCSPVVYPTSMLPEQWRLIYAINPMTGAIELMRWSMLGIDINPWPLAAVSAVSAVVLLLVGLAYFRWVEKFFADLI